MRARLLQAAKFAALGELAGNVAHEVNNPVGIIAGKARLLLTGKYELPEKVRRELEKIVDQSNRVGRLTRGLLDYCRPSMHPKEPIDVHLPITRALRFVESNIELPDGSGGGPVYVATERRIIPRRLIPGKAKPSSP